MAVDTSIYGNLLRPPKSVEDYNNEVMQQTQNRLGLLIRQNELADYQRNRAGEDALGAAIAAGGTPDQIAADLARAGHTKQALAYTRQQQELANSKATREHLDAQTGKLKGETDKIAYDQREDRRMKAITDIAAFTSPEQALASIALHEQAGDLAPEAAAAVRATLQSQPDFKKWKLGMLQGIMSAKDAVDSNETAAHNRATEQTAAGQLAVSQGQLGVARGQLGVAQAREKREATAPKGQYDAARGVLVDPRTGTATAVTGPDGKPLTRDKAMTEFQGKSAAFGDRAAAANQIITGLEGQYSPAAINSKNTVENTWLVGGALGAATNKFALSDSDQKAEQAQRDFINAVLRQESGAAIGAGEFDNARKQYFPQPGDSAAVRQQKAANRKLAVEGLQRNAGSNYQPAAATAAPKAAAGGVPDDIAALLKKHGGK